MQKEIFSKAPRSVVLAADVGGTNTKIGLCSVNGQIKLHVLYRFETKKVNSFDAVVRWIMKDAKVRVSRGCIAVAGPVSVDRKTCRLTNVPWTIDARKFPLIVCYSMISKRWVTVLMFFPQKMSKLFVKANQTSCLLACLAQAQVLVKHCSSTTKSIMCRSHLKVAMLICR